MVGNQLIEQNLLQKEVVYVQKHINLQKQVTEFEDVHEPCTEDDEPEIANLEDDVQELVMRNCKSHVL